MPRFFAAVVSIALLTLSGVSPLQHVHAYGGHDHPEHHHGPAVHGHPVAGRVHAYGDSAQALSVHLEGCEAGDHAVSAAFTYVTPHQEQAPVPLLVKVMAFIPPPVPLWTMPTVDLRTHSPPGTADASLRAPPLVIPA